VITAPPSSLGAVHDTAAVPFPGTAETLVGAPGSDTGVTELDAADDGELPTEFVATTVNV